MGGPAGSDRHGWRWAAAEGGVTLVELLLAMTLLGVVVASVDASITLLNKQQVQTLGQTQAVDELQLVEEQLVGDLQGATASPAVTATSLTFETDAAGLQQAPVTATITGSTLTVTVNGKQRLLLANLDQTSGFSIVQSCQVTGGTAPGDYVTGVGVTLEVDTPSPHAPRISRTSLSDPEVVPWNVQYAFGQAASSTGATVSMLNGQTSRCAT